MLIGKLLFKVSMGIKSVFLAKKWTNLPEWGGRAMPGDFFSVTLLVTDNQMTSFNSIIQRYEHDWEISRINPIYGKMLRIDRKFSSLLSRRQQTTVEDRKEMWYCYYYIL